MPFDAEFNRARERIHSLEKSVLALEWRIKGMEGRVEEMSPQIERLARAEEIAVAVAKQIRTNRTVRFTRTQQMFAAISVMAVIADTVSRFVH